MEPELERLEKRVQVLARQNRFMRCGTLAVLLVVGCVLVMGQARPADRKWHSARVILAERQDSRSLWNWNLISDGLLYRVVDKDPYLNGLVGSQTKIASPNGSDTPGEGEALYVIDSKGQQHSMDILSVAVAEAPCKNSDDHSR